MECRLKCQIFETSNGHKQLSLDKSLWPFDVSKIQQLKRDSIKDVEDERQNAWK
jgi:hypothetical protein